MTNIEVWESNLSYLVKKLEQCKSESQLIQLMNEISVTDKEISNELDELINKASIEYDQDSLTLDMAKTELLTSLSTSTSLIKILSESSTLATALTYKVKYLDIQRSRVEKTSNYVKDIINLKKHLKITSESLDSKDWSSASRSIDFILKNVSSEIINNSKFAEIMIPTAEIPDPPEKLLKEWTSGLESYYLKEFQNAVRAKDIVKLTSFFSYFPMIGKSERGITCYSQFISNIISDQARSLLINAPRDKLNFFSAALMKLFEVVSKIINQHSKVILKYYSNRDMIEVINKISKEVDSQAGLITDTFYDLRNFDKLLHDISNYTFPYLNDKMNGIVNNNAAETEDIIEQIVTVVEISDYINEISNLLNKWGLYCNYITIKYEEYYKAGGMPIDYKLPLPIVESAFREKVDSKMLPLLEKLANYYLKKSLEKSLQMEKLTDITQYLKPFLKSYSTQPLTFSELESLTPVDNPPVTSVIEDLVVILNTVLTNGIEIGNASCLRSLFSDVKKILITIFFKIIMKNIQKSQPRQNSNLLNVADSILSAMKQEELKKEELKNKSIITGNLSSLQSNDLKNLSVSIADKDDGVFADILLNALGMNDELTLVNLITYCNSVCVFKTYFYNLLSTLTNFEKIPGKDTLLSKNFQSEEELGKMQDYIKENLVSPIIAVCDNLTKQLALIFYNKIFQNRIRSIINDFFSYNNSYLINDDIYSSLDTKKKFLTNWLTLIKPYYKILASDLFTKIQILIVDLVADLLEKKIWLLHKKINLYGIIKLEKDISMIINEVTKNYYTLRERFLRVSQIVMVMGIDENDENDEDDPIEWILTKNERKKAMQLKID